MPTESQFPFDQLSKRERQVMDALLVLDQGTVADIQRRLGESLSYSAVRAVLRVLAAKKLVSHKFDGPRYLYKPVLPKQRTKKTVLKKVIETFFDGSREQLIAALLDSKELKTNPAKLDRLAEMIRQARKQGR